MAFVGGAASGNPGDRRLGTILTVEAGNPGEAITRAVEALPISGFIVAAEVMTVEEADRRLEEPSFPDLAGVAERKCSASRASASGPARAAGFPGARGALERPVGGSAT